MNTRAPIALLATVLLVACAEPTANEGPQADVPTGDVMDETGTTESPDTDDQGPDTTPDEGVDTPTPTECPPDADCDDGLACTVDACSMPGEVCGWTLSEGSCLINNVCYAAGASKPGAACFACDPATDPWTWTVLPDGAACEASSACIEATACSGGLCEGEAITCDDGNPCTTNSCELATGCVHAPVDDGAACDDADVCTTAEQCVLGFCIGLDISCDDGDACTIDLCNPETGCQAEPIGGGAPCEDGNPCTAADSCIDGACVPGPPADCADDNPCTLDLCDADAGCVQLPTESPCCQGIASVCDDADPCTTDVCDPLTADCSYELSDAVCDDGSACTVGDACVGGSCLGAELSCDDANPCTTDACDPSVGCVHAPTSGDLCDDGLECSTGDVCVSGACTGDTGACACTPELQGDFAKVNGLAIGTDGKPGSGLDVDDDPATCAPASSCEAGVDNAFAGLSGLANGPLGDAIAGGDLMLILDAPPGASGAFELYVYQGGLDPANAECAHMTDLCDYTLGAGSFTADTCAPLFQLPATLDGDQLKAGGASSNFPFSLPLSPGVVLDVTVFMVRIEGTVTVEAGEITGFDGLMGGALTESSIVTALEAIPDEDLPIPKAALIAILKSSLELDIDTDGDGTDDASSIGFTMTALDGNVTGVE